MPHQQHIQKLSGAGLLVTLGIIFGDIGTSPLYVMSAIVGQNNITEQLVLGGISCVFWTLTLQTTVKYVFITLNADNKGEGGIFSLYQLLKRRYRNLIIGAIIGGAMLLADGIITPPISVSSAIEGLSLIYPEIQTVPIVIAVISFIFLFQRVGTNVVGKFFGPLMLIWFLMLGVLGINSIVGNISVLRAFNPVYAIDLLQNYPGGFALLGAVFLCTTGAEALYSDLGHCGKQNIRISWIFVKTCLLLSYFGQGAWLLTRVGETLGPNERPFYALMPDWFLLPGIAIATAAAIIASQALISGSFTLVSEAIRLHLVPKMTVKFPSNFKGQIYIPIVNFVLWAGCVMVVLYFKESAKMEAAYGLAITVAMLMTTILLAYYLRMRRVNRFIIALIILIFIIVEGAFLAANLLKFMHGGYVTLIMAFIAIALMYVCFRAAIIKKRLIEFVKVNSYKDKLISLSKDTSLPKFATHLVYLSKAHKDDEVEQTILYSILQKRPKRADFYWFVNVDVTDEPYTMEYTANVIAKDDIIRVRFKLGFRVQQRISYFLRLVIEEMVQKREIRLDPHYHAFNDPNYIGDFRFVIIEEELSVENELPFADQFVMNTYMGIKGLTGSPEKWFGLDESVVTEELVPLVIQPRTRVDLRRVQR
jgi:KUP system potassium uptake protein